MQVWQAPRNFPDRLNHVLGLREGPHAIGRVIRQLVAGSDKIQSYASGETGFCRAQTSEGTEQSADKRTGTGQQGTDIAQMNERWFKMVSPEMVSSIRYPAGAQHREIIEIAPDRDTGHARGV